MKLKPFLVDSRIALANWTMRLPSHRARVYFARSLLRWTLGENVAIGRYLTVVDLGGVTVGSLVNIGHHAHIDGRGGITIGNTVDMASGVTIFSADHDPDDPDYGSRMRPTVIGDRVWLATGATVMSGATLADGVIVGAGSVAAGKLEENGIYTGNPARFVRQRGPRAQIGLKSYRRYWL